MLCYGGEGGGGGGAIQTQTRQPCIPDISAPVTQPPHPYNHLIWCMAKWLAHLATISGYPNGQVADYDKGVKTHMERKDQRYCPYRKPFSSDILDISIRQL